MRKYVNNVNLYESYVTFKMFGWFIFEINLYYITMPLLTVLIVLIVAGVLLWLVNNYIPMDGKIKNIFNIVVVIVVIVWLLKVFGIFSFLKDIHI
jgi:hypothetical protein